MILTAQPSDPFWRVVPLGNVAENLLGYRCAPNHADASYAGARRIEEFIAYGFQTCWLSPDDFSLWWRLERNDIQRLREYFLRVLEDVLLLWYSDGADWELPVSDFGDVSNDACLNVGNSDEGEPEEVMFQWWPEQFSEDVFSMSLGCTVLASDAPGATGGDDSTIFLAREAIEDRARVRCSIQWARKRNALPSVSGEEYKIPEAWQALGVELIDPPDVADCFAFGRWWEEQANGE
jgi:hypothetical protein